jgi:hypothetical protein
MSFAVSVIAILSIVVFLGGAVSGMFVLFVVSIHRTRRVPLSEVHGEERGCVSRGVLAGGRVNGRGEGE